MSPSKLRLETVFDSFQVLLDVPIEVPFGGSDEFGVNSASGASVRPNSGARNARYASSRSGNMTFPRDPAHELAAL